MHIKNYKILLVAVVITAALNAPAQNAARQNDQPVRPASRMPSVIISPELLPDNKVTFRIIRSNS